MRQKINLSNFLFTTEGESIGTGWQSALGSENKLPLIEGVRKVLSLLGCKPMNPNVWYVKSSVFIDSFFSICIDPLGSKSPELKGKITVDVSFIGPDNKESVIINRMLIPSPQFLKELFENQFHLRHIYQDALRTSDELKWRNGDYSTLFPDKSRSRNCKDVIHPEGMYLCRHSYARELLRLNSGI